MFPRRFALVRHVDYTGVSGVGVVAYGVVFAGGQVALRWCSTNPSVSVWESIDDVVAVHGHGRATSVEWIDDPRDDASLVHAVEQHQAAVTGIDGPAPAAPADRSPADGPATAMTASGTAGATVGDTATVETTSGTMTTATTGATRTTRPDAADAADTADAPRPAPPHRPVPARPGPPPPEPPPPPPAPHGQAAADSVVPLVPDQVTGPPRATPNGSNSDHDSDTPRPRRRPGRHRRRDQDDPTSLHLVRDEPR